MRNGGAYVKDCINSILKQSCNNFNLIVLDNASSDGTTKWISELNDARIQVFVSDKPLTIEENWSRILTVPKNEFITLIGHDDILKENYLEKMNELIEMHPEASLYQTHFSYIDKDGLLLRKCKPMVEQENAEDFLKKFLLNDIDIMGTGFMMRAKDYDEIGGIPNYPNLLFADFELWIKLTEKSYKATALAECFSFRLHQSTTSISPDTKFHQAFEKFIYFLQQLRNQKKSFSEVIKSFGKPFLLFYCKGLSHRLLRTPQTKRGNLSVKGFINKCISYAQMLGIEKGFEPEKIVSIRLAKLIDSNRIGRTVFLAFKKIYSRPVLK